MSLVDTHAHLDHPRFDPDREEVIERTLSAGVQVIAVGTDPASSGQAVRIAQKYGLYAAVGIHPHEVGRFVRNGELAPNVLPQLKDLLEEERVVAVGEIGLDYFKEYSSRDAQRVAFHAQLELAQRWNKPVVIHNRDSEDDIVWVLSQHECTGVVHSFNQDWTFAEQALDLGYYLGVNGIATFAKDDALQRALKRIPTDRLLLETDCPYLAPVPQRGRRNEPRYVQHVAEYLAHHRGMPTQVLAEATTENARRLFQLSRSS